MVPGMENYTVKFCSKYSHDEFIYKKERNRRAIGEPWGGAIMRRMMRSLATVAKITLVCLNLWVLAVVLVVSLGHWRVFDTENSAAIYDNSHLVVMRELQGQEAERRLPIMALPVTNISDVESYYVPPGDSSHLFLSEAEKKAAANMDPGGGETAALLFKAKPAVKGSPSSSSASSSKVKRSVSEDIAPPVANPQPPKSAPEVKKQPPKETVKVSDIGSDKLSNMRHWCQQHHDNKVPFDKIPASRLLNIFLDEKHKLLFCQIPGVVLNEWRRLLLVSTGVVKSKSPTEIQIGDVFGKYGKSIKRLSDVSKIEDRAKILSTFKKVIFVRDPLERLMMTYITKFKSKYGKYFHQTYGKSIIKKYRPDASEKDLETGESVKFSEFARYIVDTEHEGSALNEHWQQYYKQCHPCAVDYDFIGTFENAEEHTKKVLQEVQADKTMSPPYIGWSKTLTDKELSKAYGEVDITVLKNLYKVYSTDYTMFGYKCPSFFHSLMEKAKAFHDY